MPVWPAFPVVQCVAWLHELAGAAQMPHLIDEPDVASELHLQARALSCRLYHNKRIPASTKDTVPLHYSTRNVSFLMWSIEHLIVVAQRSSPGCLIQFISNVLSLCVGSVSMHCETAYSWWSWLMDAACTGACSCATLFHIKLSELSHTQVMLHTTKTLINFCF